MPSNTLGTEAWPTALTWTTASGQGTSLPLRQMNSGRAPASFARAESTIHTSPATVPRTPARTDSAERCRCDRGGKETSAKGAVYARADILAAVPPPVSCSDSLPVLRADRARLRADFEALAAIGSQPSGGLMREAYSPAFLEARAFARRRLDEAGLVTRVDAVGNLFGRTGAPDEAVVLTGSHLDAVPNGGAFDGAAGVIAGLEAVRTIVEAGVPLGKPLEVVGFVEEEGRFSGLL